MAVKSRRAEHAADTRDALVRAAGELFAEQGFASTSLSEIVDRARVTTGALYHHFANKQDLFRAVVEASSRETLDRLVERMTARAEVELRGADLWELIRAGAQDFLDELDPAYLRLVRVEAPSALSWEEARALAKAAYLQVFEDWLRVAMDDGLIDPLPVEALRDLIGGLLGEAMSYIAYAEDPATARREAGEVLDRLLAGLRA